MLPLKNHDYKRNLKLATILCGQRPKEILRHIDIYNLSFEQNFLVTALVTSNENIEWEIPHWRDKIFMISRKWENLCHSMYENWLQISAVT